MGTNQIVIEGTQKSQSERIEAYVKPSFTYWQHGVKFTEGMKVSLTQKEYGEAERMFQLVESAPVEATRVETPVANQTLTDETVQADETTEKADASTSDDESQKKDDESKSKDVKGRITITKPLDGTTVAK